MISLELFNLKILLFFFYSNVCLVFIMRAGGEKLRRPFERREQNNNYYLRGMTMIPKVNLRNDTLKRTAVEDVDMLFHTHCYIQKAWMKSFSSFNLGVWACVCTSVYFFFWSVVTHSTDWPACVHNASTPVNVNAVLLVGFFFFFWFYVIFFPHHFVFFVRMQMSLIKFLL